VHSRLRAHRLSAECASASCVVLARGSNAQRAEAAARHQDRSTPAGGKIWAKYRGLSVFFHDTGGLSRNSGNIWEYLGINPRNVKVKSDNPWYDEKIR